MGSGFVPEWFWLLVLFAFGLVFGSFGNVVIWRLPRGESLSHPSSHCPTCGAPIAWYDNIPVVSWLVLRSRCRNCKAPISPRYPIVELLSGLLWVAAGVRFGQSLSALAAAAFFYLLLLLAWIDFDTMRLPNVLVGTLAVLGALGVIVGAVGGLPVTPLVFWTGPRLLANPIASALVGVVSGGGIILLITLAYAFVRKAQGIGLGDVKLMAAMGTFLGVYTPLAFFFGALVGAVYGIVSASHAGEGARHRFPFGPFLAIGGVVVALFGPAIWAWYAGLAHIRL